MVRGAVIIGLWLGFSQASAAPTAAPAAFDNQTNGYVDDATHDDDRSIFDEGLTLQDGLGPVYNAPACGSCHASPVTGGWSSATNLRAGQVVNKVFEDAAGGSLISERAIDASIVEHVPVDADVRVRRLSTSVLGLGFVEAIADSTLVSLAAGQPGLSNGKIAGEVVRVGVLEANGQLRVGRFGWKNQHASLVSAAASELAEQLGITTPLLPAEQTSLGASVSAFDAVVDPETADRHVLLTRFLRATKAPPPDPVLINTPDAKAGAVLFEQVGCAVCHVPTIVTAPPGTQINGGTFTVPAALGEKIIHPYGDFLLHDVGTGDGVPQAAAPADKVRTAPLWGLRTHVRYLHDGSALTLGEAIAAHKGEAAAVTRAFRRLSDAEQAQLIRFLEAL